MVIELTGGGWGGDMEGLLVEDNCWSDQLGARLLEVRSSLPLDRKLVSVKFSGLALALPTLSLGFCGSQRLAAGKKR